MGFLTDLPMAYPGLHRADPEVGGDAAASPARRRVQHDRGRQVAPRARRASVRIAGPFDRWPLGFGFERYYGFLQGDTNHWAPNLVRDNHYVDPPRAPDDGYHLTEDLADHAIRYVTDAARTPRPIGRSSSTSRSARCTRRTTSRPEWVEPYRGRFDGGWEAWREEVFARQLELGIVPDGTALGPTARAGSHDWDAARRRRAAHAARASRRCSPGSSRTPTRRSGACSSLPRTTSACSTTRS